MYEWKLVPVEPTDEMGSAGEECDIPNHYLEHDRGPMLLKACCDVHWTAMIEQSPDPAEDKELVNNIHKIIKDAMLYGDSPMDITLQVLNELYHK